MAMRRDGPAAACGSKYRPAGRAACGSKYRPAGRAAQRGGCGRRVRLRWGRVWGWLGYYTCTLLTLLSFPLACQQPRRPTPSRSCNCPSSLCATRLGAWTVVSCRRSPHLPIVPHRPRLPPLPDPWPVGRPHPRARHLCRVLLLHRLLGWRRRRRPRATPLLPLRRGRPSVQQVQYRGTKHGTKDRGTMHRPTKHGGARAGRCGS